MLYNIYSDIAFFNQKEPRRQSRYVGSALFLGDSLESDDVRTCVLVTRWEPKQHFK